MKRNVFIAVAVFLLSLMLTDIVLAAYYIDIDVTESNGTDYDMLAMNVSMDIDYLADNGFINADGLDVRVQTSSGSSLPFMPVEDKLMFASAIEGDKTTGFQMITGNTPLDSFPVIVGDGGYVTITDHADLELGDDFEIEIEGYIDTTDTLTLVEKTDAFDITTDGAGNIDATIYGHAGLSNTNENASDALFSGSVTRAGQRLDDVPIGYITQLSFYLKRSGTVAGTIYIRVRTVSGDSILGTIGTMDSTTLTTSNVWYDFTGSVYNPSVQDLRFTVEYSGAGDISNCVKVAYDSSNTISGVWTRYAGSWTDDSGKDRSVKVYFADITITAAVTADVHIIKLTGDGSDFKLYADDVEKDSTTVVPILDNGNNWVVADIPYYNYYTHTTSDTLRITYEPTDIISGTTLINEANPGTHDGVITWGANPAGISISTSGLLLDESYYYTGGESGTTDIFEPEPAQLAPGLDSDKLDHNPLSPGVEGFAAASNGGFTESLVWYGIAWFSVIAIAIALVIFVREHLVFAASVSFGLSIFWYVSGVFDYWVLIIFGIFFGATLIHERMPTW